MTPNEFLLHKILRELVFTVQVAEKEAKKWAKAVLRHARQVALDELVNFTSRNVVAREHLELFEGRLRATLAAYVAEHLPELAEQVEKVLTTRVAGVTSVFQQALEKGGVKRAISKAIAEGRRVDLADIQIGGVRFADALSKITDELANKVAGLAREKWGQSFMRQLYEGASAGQAMVAATVEAGVDVRDLRAVRELFGEKTVKRISSLVTDYTAAALDQKTAQLYAQNSDLIAGFQWVATLDRKTCPRCAALDGRRWYFQTTKPELSVERMPPIPLHPRCRCTKVPILKVDEHQPSTVGFAEWFYNLDEDEKRRMLGAKRYELYRQGVPLKWLVNERGELVPIENLERALQKAPEKILAPYRATQGVSVFPGEEWSDDLYREDFRKHLQAICGKLPLVSDDLYSSVRYYQSDGYKEINQFAASGIVPPGTQLSKLKKAMDDLDRAAVFEAKRNFVVFRGCPKEVLEQLDVLRPGVVVQCDAYMSTSLIEDVATKFAPPKSGAVLEIIVPAGTRFAVPTAVTGSLPYEYEILFPRGVRLRIYKVEPGTKGMPTVVKAIMIRGGE